MSGRSLPTAPPPTTVGIDIGGTKTLAAVVDSTGCILARAHAPTPATDGPAAVLATAQRCVESAVADLPEDLHPSACGVAAAGTIGPHGVVVASTDLITDWAGTDLRGRLTRATGLPTRVVNDVHGAAVAEGRLGAARGRSCALVVTVGTGIGGAVLVDGEVVPGARAAAGALGHLPVGPLRGRPCSCGVPDHLEAYAAGPGMARSLAERRRGSNGPGASVTPSRSSTFHDVVRAAAAGDVDALAVLDEGAGLLGAALAGAVALLAPEVVVLGGGVFTDGDLLLGRVRAAYASHVLPTGRDVPVVRAHFGPDAAVIGAALLAPTPPEGHPAHPRLPTQPHTRRSIS